MTALDMPNVTITTRKLSGGIQLLTDFTINDQRIPVTSVNVEDVAQGPTTVTITFYARVVERVTENDE